METSTNAAPPVPLARLVRFLWWTGITILWITYLIFLAAPFVSLLWAAEKFSEWADGENWVIRLKYWIETIAPSDETNA